MKVHKAPIVKALGAYYGDLLYELEKFPSILNHLAALAEKMMEGMNGQNIFLYKEVNNYHKDLLGKPIEELKVMNLTLEDCRQAIANEYGFDNWAAVENLGSLNYDHQFEEAVNVLLHGDLDKLKAIIEKNPAIVNQRSQYGHQATLLHYTGSNGVEAWRQMVPINLPEITRLLLEKGADKNAKMKVYGGYYDTLALLETSGHPFEAGVGEEMKRILAE